FHVRAGGASPAPTSTLLDDLFSFRSIKRLSPNYLAAWHYRRSVSEESSATLDRPSIRVDTLVCQTPHAMHALCVLFGPLLSQGAPISKSVCLSSPSPGAGALSWCVSVSVARSLHQTGCVLSVAPSGITPYST